MTWIDAIVRYLVASREAGPVKSRLIPKLLAALQRCAGEGHVPQRHAR